MTMTDNLGRFKNLESRFKIDQAPLRPAKPSVLDNKKDVALPT